MITDELKSDWNKVVELVSERFGGGEELDLEAIIFLIGIQELGKGYKKLKKDDKVNAMHIAICRLLEPYGYYRFEGVDPDGWPQYSKLDNLPFLKPGEQSILMKEAIVRYFKESELF